MLRASPVSKESTRPANQEAASADVQLVKPATSPMAIIVLNDISFNDGSDVVDGSRLTPPAPLYVGSVNASGDPTFEAGNSVSTGKGNDKLIGKMYDTSTPSGFPGDPIRVGVLLLNSLFLGEGNDKLTGSAFTSTGGNLVYGLDLDLSGSVYAGQGNDQISGLAHSESAASFIVTGIVINSDTTDATIDTGTGMPSDSNTGNDTVTGIASGYTSRFMNGISLTGINPSIQTHDGNDVVTGITNALGSPADTPVGIFMVASASIETGSGNDKVIGRATLNGATLNGFEGPGMVDLGAGNDFLEGFGGITAKGGLGKDTWNLSAYNRTDFAIEKTGSNAASFTNSGVTATIDGFETFVFADGIFSYATLV